jgi:hypothetical protein
VRRILRKIGVTLAILAVMAVAVAPGTASAGGKTFIGPANDSFFIDLGSVFD